MQTWINFFNFIFWLSLISFLANFSNFIKLLFYSEISWIILYCLVLLESSINDDITLLSTSIFILGLAGIEYSIGILLVIMFKQINKKTDFDEIDNNAQNESILLKTNLFLNRYIWN